MKKIDSIVTTAPQTVDRFTKVKRATSSLTIYIYGTRESGKTSFVIKFCEKKFDTFYIPSIQNEITNYSSTLNMKRFSLKFIVSQYENYSLNELKQSDSVLIFFDSTDNNSFAKAKEFLLKILSDAGNIPICLVANKIDLKRRNYNDKEAKELCSKNKIEIFEISVKDNTGISKMMQYIGTFYDTGEQNE